MPTAHGFDKFSGILYHLNAGEYKELYDYPKDPELLAKLAQRGVTHSWAKADGTQKVEDKGEFEKERQCTLDDEILVESKPFIKDVIKDGGFRVPVLIKWPGVINPGSVSAKFMTMEDWIPTIMEELGEPKLK